MIFAWSVVAAVVPTEVDTASPMTYTASVVSYIALTGVYVLSGVALVLVVALVFRLLVLRPRASRQGRTS